MDSVPDDSLQSLVAASRNWIGDAPDGAMLKATRAFLARVRDDPEILQQVAGSLKDLEPGAAAWTAVACGTALENSSPAEFTGPAVFDLLRAWLPKFPRIAEDADVPALSPEQRALLPLFRYVCQATVTHLARLPSQREALSGDLPLLARLGELQALSHGAVWVREALLKSSGTLVLLHPSSNAGFKIRYANVSNNFHLFSLLQSVIGTELPGGRQPDATLARIARGKGAEAATDEAWWHYGSVVSNKADMAASIWGEGLVREIPRMDGMPVILAWPPLLQSRTWDAGFLGPHLDAMPADAEIESRLTPEEVRSWLGRLAGERKPWWKFWQASR